MLCLGCTTALEGRKQEGRHQGTPVTSTFKQFRACLSSCVRVCAAGTSCTDLEGTQASQRNQFIYACDLSNLPGCSRQRVAPGD